MFSWVLLDRGKTTVTFLYLYKVQIYLGIQQVADLLKG